MPPEGFHEGTFEDLNRSYYLLLHSCGALLDELLGDAGTAASGTDGEGFGLGQKLVVGHLDAVLFGQLGEDDLEPGFLGPLEGDDEAEPGRKAHQLLTGVGLVDVIAGAVGEGLLDEVAAVGGSVNGDVPGSAAHAALEDGFQGRKVVVVGREAQIVDEEDELQWVRRQLVHQIGDLIELVLFDFHEAQAVGGELVGDGLDGAGLARTGVAVEQNIVGGHPGQQGAGVGDDLLPLLLIARQLVEALGVGVAHRHQLAVLDREDVVLGEHSVALFAHLAHPLGVGGVEVDGLRLPPGQERQLVGGTGGVQKLVQRQAAQLPQEVQLIVQCSLQDGRHFADSRLPDTDRLGFEDGSGKVFAEIGGVLEEGCFEGSGSVAHGSRALGGSGHPVGEVNKFCNDVIVQQGAEDDQPVEPGVPFCEVHNLVPLYSFLENLSVTPAVHGQACLRTTSQSASQPAPLVGEPLAKR